MISLNAISLMRGSNMLLQDASLVLYGGQRVGIIGRNGSGKTSLFAALAGNLGLEAGDISMPETLQVSTMEQETAGSSRTAIEHVIDAHGRYRALEQRLQHAEDNDDHANIVRIHAELDQIDAYSITNRAEQLLSGLGFATTQFANPVSSFSGGWRVRLNLAAALMCPSDLLLLDEPTNHLDLEATLWLEQWLNRYEGTLLMISHDRSFLDKVVDHIVSFENRLLQLYRGNYSSYEKLRAERMALEQAMYEKQKRRRSEIENFVRKFRAKASKARQAQSRLKELDRMQEIAPAHIDSPFRFTFPALDRVPDFLMSLDKLSIGFDKVLAANIRLTIRNGSRIGLLGFNGSGKSTLLKVLAGKLAPLSGELEPAKHSRIGYFAQHQVDELDQQATPLEIIQTQSKLMAKPITEQEIRDYLGGFDFKGSRVDEKITVFSGGEKARLALAKVTWTSPNLLLLDEPTNHLDLEMRHALTIALQGFEGAIVLVSHDRHLLANTVDEFYSIHEGKFSEFEGDLNDYEKWVQSSTRDKMDAIKGPVTSAASGRTDSAGSERTDKKEARQQAALLREQQAPLRKTLKALDTQLTTLTKELANIDQDLSEASLYDEENKNKLKRLLVRQGELKTTLEHTEEQWFEIQEELEAS